MSLQTTRLLCLGSLACPTPMDEGPAAGRRPGVRGRGLARAAPTGEGPAATGPSGVWGLASRCRSPGAARWAAEAGGLGTPEARRGSGAWGSFRPLAPPAAAGAPLTVMQAAGMTGAWPPGDWLEAPAEAAPADLAAAMPGGMGGEPAAQAVSANASARPRQVHGVLSHQRRVATRAAAAQGGPSFG